MFDAKRWQRVVKIMLPVAVPSIFGGLRLAVIFSLLGVTASEMIASREGIGQLILFYAGIFRIDAVYGNIIFLSAMGVIINAGMRRVEARLSRWNQGVDLS